VDEDTQAFNKIMDAFGLPNGSEEEKSARKDAIQKATKHAIDIPFRVMQTAHASMEVIKAMAELGNPNSVSDAGVGALAARSAVMGAFLNVKINAGDVDDKAWVQTMLEKAEVIQSKAITLERQILDIVQQKL